jgi:hypothetical protein
LQWSGVAVGVADRHEHDVRVADWLALQNAIEQHAKPFAGNHVGK